MNIYQFLDYLDTFAGQGYWLWGAGIGLVLGFAFKLAKKGHNSILPGITIALGAILLGLAYCGIVVRIGELLSPQDCRWRYILGCIVIGGALLVCGLWKGEEEKNDER